MAKIVHQPYYEEPNARQYCGDALQVLRQLRAQCAQCCVTSPPYWGPRKYSGEQEIVWGDGHCEHEWGIETISAETWNRDGHVDFGDKQPKRSARPNRWQTVEHKRGFCSLCGAWKGAFGLEPTPEMYVEHTIEFLRAIRRVLRKDGVVFWNIGDSYASQAGGYSDKGSRGRNDCISVKTRAAVLSGKRRQRPPGLKPKDLCQIPERVGIAACDDGWWVRSKIIWSKNNPMPESVKDRPTDSHEYILMLTKAKSYYWDIDAVREPQTGGAHSRGTEACNKPYQEARGSYHDFYSPVVELPGGRNMRTVWTMNTEPYPDAHFAVFPTELPRRCILAATSEKGNCSNCGKPWVRITEPRFTDHTGNTESAYDKGTTANRLALLRQAAREQGGEYSSETKTVGWKPQCKCNAEIEPPVVLDPFSGVGTTGVVAKQLGRRAILIDTSEDYCRMAQRRIEEVPIPMML